MLPINTSFGSYSDAEFENKAQNIFQLISTEKSFTPPFAGMAALEASIKTYSEVLAASMNGDRLIIAKKNAARTALEKMLKKVAGYVTMIAGDDTTLISLSGFDVRKPREPRPAVSAPENIQVESGDNDGELLVSVNAVSDVKTYHFEHTADPLTESSTWTTALETRSSHLFTGLKPGQKYWFRVAAVGLRGIKVYSNEVACFAQ